MVGEAGEPAGAGQELPTVLRRDAGQDPEQARLVTPLDAVCRVGAGLERTDGHVRRLAVVRVPPAYPSLTGAVR
jgi:hypothetical protein